MSRIRSLSLLLALALLGAPAWQDGAPLQILFIGSSYTYYNNLPQMLERLGAAAEPPLAVHTRMVVEGGATLQEHWDGGAARAALASQHWDYVVLQAQSTLGTTYLVEGKERVADNERFVDAAERWVAAIRRAGARAVLMVHWKREASPMRDQQALDAAFVQVARHSGALLAPVGMAWQQVRARRPDLDLYADDGSHPSAAGSYVAACTLYATILGRDPQGLPGRVEGNPVDRDSGEVAGDSVVALVALAHDDAAAIQRAAARAAQQLRSGPAALDPGQVPPIELPQLPAGRPFDDADVVGSWEGEARHYPDFVTWPATMRLEVELRGDGLRARFTLSFGGRPDDIVRTVDLRRDGNVFEFVDPDGPNGGVVRYRGVYTGDALLGIGEILVEDAPIYAIGGWRLTRVH